MKPMFSTAPGAWTRTQRTAVSAVEYANSIEYPARDESKAGRAAAWFCVALLCVVAAVHVIARYV